jgi:hypothetical protein
MTNSKSHAVAWPDLSAATNPMAPSNSSGTKRAMATQLMVCDSPRNQNPTTFPSTVRRKSAGRSRISAMALSRKTLLARISSSMLMNVHQYVDWKSPPSFTAIPLAAIVL